MNNKVQTFVGIMVFYAVLACALFPLGFYYFVDKTLLGAGNGFVLGSLASIALWLGFGKNMI